MPISAPGWTQPPIALPDLSAFGYDVLRVLGENRSGGRITYLAQVIVQETAPEIGQARESEIAPETQHNANSSVNSSQANPQKNSPPQLVVLKAFQFAQLGNAWSGYEAIERESVILQTLNHPGIPRYYGLLHTEQAVYLVQEYKDAPNLAQVILRSQSTQSTQSTQQRSRSTDPSSPLSHPSTNPPPTLTPGMGDSLTQSMAIATQILKILVYLQNHLPPVLHRDIKPENILLSATGDVFLVDFGFARLGLGTGNVSSMVRGTLGFMSPEQLLNRPLTAATDLYGLGATLLCVLTGTPSDRVGDWLDEAMRFQVDRAIAHLQRGRGISQSASQGVSQGAGLNPRQNLRDIGQDMPGLGSESAFFQWLARLLEPSPDRRFPNAQAALTALEGLQAEIVASSIARKAGSPIANTAQRVADGSLAEGSLADGSITEEITGATTLPPIHEGKGKAQSVQEFQDVQGVQGNQNDRKMDQTITRPLPPTIEQIPWRSLGALSVGVALFVWQLEAWWHLSQAIGQALQQALQWLWTV